MDSQIADGRFAYHFAEKSAARHFVKSDVRFLVGDDSGIHLGTDLDHGLDRRNIDDPHQDDVRLAQLSVGLSLNHVPRDRSHNPRFRQRELSTGDARFGLLESGTIECVFRGGRLFFRVGCMPRRGRLGSCNQRTRLLLIGPSQPGFALLEFGFHEVQGGFGLLDRFLEFGIA